MTDYSLPPENVIAKEIPGYLGYWATDDGRVWSGHHGGKWKVFYTQNSYATIRFGSLRGKKRPSCTVHRLVALAFLGKSPLPYVRHVNGNKNDNTLANLAYGTAMDNTDDEVRLGRTKTGTRSQTAKFSPDQIREILVSLVFGAAYREIARQYNVTPAAVRFVALGRSYRYVSRAPFNPSLFRREPCMSRHYVKVRLYRPE